jgi:putative endonuclease
MSLYTTYILYSAQMDRYYVGSTSKTIEERLSYHLSNHNGYTGKAKDWIIVYESEYSTVQESRKLERKIKKRGAKWYLETSCD